MNISMITRTLDSAQEKYDDAIKKVEAALEGKIEFEFSVCYQKLEKNLSEDNIYDRADEESDYWSDNVRDAAIEARNWLDGNLTDYPDLVSSWKELTE